MKIIFIILIFLSLMVNGKNLILIHTNNIQDVWGERDASFINPDFPPQLGGAASFYTALKWEREKAEKNDDILLVFDSGNFSKKTIDMKTDMFTAIRFFNHFKYSAVNLGIDELYGEGEYLKEQLDMFVMPVFLSNVKFKNVNMNTKAYHIFDIQGVRVGVFGLTSEYAYFNLPESILENIEIEKEIDAAKRIVKILKDSRCDIIIALTSIGYNHDYSIAEKIESIDVILGGFEGTGMNVPVETPLNHTIIFRQYGELSTYSKLVIYLDQLNKIDGYDGESVTLFKEAFPPIYEIEKIINKQED